MSTSSTDFITALEQLCRERKTGSFLVIVGSKTAYISLQNGEICYVFFKGQKSVDAINLLRSELAKLSNSLQIRFSEGSVANIESNLPSTREILEQLSEGASTSNPSALAQASTNTNNSTNTPTVTASTNLPPNPGVFLTDDIKLMLENTLAEYIGPIATTLCSETFSKTRTLRAALELLLERLPDPQLAEQFLTQVRTYVSPSSQPKYYKFGLDKPAEQEAVVTATKGTVLTEEMKTNLRAVLPDFFGPIAPIIADEVLDRADTLRAAIDQLAARMPDPDSVQQLRDALGKLFRTS